MIIWEPIKGLKLHQIDFHQRYVTCCAFSCDGQLLATGSNDKCVAVWKVVEQTSDGMVMSYCNTVRSFKTYMVIQPYLEPLPYMELLPYMVLFPYIIKLKNSFHVSSILKCFHIWFSLKAD